MEAETANATDEYGIPVAPGLPDAARRKRQAIMEAAAAEFLAEGYSAASMDSITSRSGVSKATVYKHFGNKERLFLAAIGGILRRTYAGLEPYGSTIAEAGDLRGALIGATRDWAALLLRPDIVSLRRLVIGETDRFPQLGRLWYDLTYDMCDGPLTEAVAALGRSGKLDVPDPVLAVRQLVATTVGVPQLVHTFLPDTETDPAELTRVVTSGVDLFLARYATPTDCR
ncbi:MULTISPECIES: TetR/AcrR family transcriptional regulator [unclassified Streptomyces]|uniref:TetR/AcrR family transcriptional regulator n=1 Tax=unclassified Streptomyces TaxID=2593676 RepID=UPI000DC7B954|nr:MULTISPECIES: TetR/AcrR family transcriptional regulator [unclassified Streptomyces]AWZ08789.1 TetR/AcrR family transcriptional regulator [Streptomyces sp. ICC4]AWZ14214.1 TetR/AcrR family transcriptional regulator [Streptomyces sp. ICC1]